MSLELIFSCEREKVTSKKDAVICATHSALLSAGLKCVGCGEQLVVTEETRGSDMMPNGWNSGSGVYVIHYRNESSKEKVYMLRALAVDNSLFIQLMRTIDGTFSDVNVSVENFVSDNLNEFNKTYTDVDGLMNTLRTQLINPVLTCPLASSFSSSASSSTRSSDRMSTGGGVISDHGHCGDPLMGNGGSIPNPNAPRIGNTDLDPFGRGQAGMVFDPFRTGEGMPGMFGPPGTGVTGPGLPLSIVANSQDDKKDFCDDEVSDQPLDLTMNKTKTDESRAQVIQLQAPTANLSSVTTPAGSVNVAGAGSTGQTMQIMTQIMTPSGDIQQIPLNIDPSQLQAIQAQMQGKQPNQPIIIETSVDSSVAASGSIDTIQSAQQNDSGKRKNTADEDKLDDETAEPSKKEPKVDTEHIDPSQLQAEQAQTQGQQPNQPIVNQSSVNGSVTASGSVSAAQSVQTVRMRKRSDCIPVCVCAAKTRVLSKLPQPLLQELRDKVRVIDVEFCGDKLVDIAVLDGAGDTVLRLFAAKPAEVSQVEWNQCRHRGLDSDLLDLASITRRVQAELEGRLVLGHNLSGDIRSANLIVEKSKIRDTFRSLVKLSRCGYIHFPAYGLQALMLEYGIDVQPPVHCPVEDCMACLFIYIVNQHAIDWVSVQQSSGDTVPAAAAVPLILPSCAIPRATKVWNAVAGGWSSLMNYIFPSSQPPE